MLISRALVSVHNKDKIVKFATGLRELGINIISTEGTKTILRENGLKTESVSNVLDYPEILDGRVKTLHPKIHAGILALRNRENHIQELQKLGIEPIDLVVVNLYPFQDIIKKEHTIFEALENIDIGGPTLIRAAAKNYKNVGIIVDPSDYEKILSELKKNNCNLTKKTRKKLAIKAFKTTARYDITISNYMDKKTKEEIKKCLFY